ncbi:hypothetical protein [Planococcus sp. SSTMD024]|uniref:hypothetical protein n=1 Tax=Planococcus sp. SSTMD024 TaxID=3242163 RepID=UPI00351DCF95
MTEKPVLTKEQAAALEAALREDRPDQILKRAARDHETWFFDCHPLNYLELPVLAKALYVGYEVEEVAYLPGDMVVYKNGGLFANGKRIATVHAHDRENRAVMFDSTFNHPLNTMGTKQLRKATPDEIFWFCELGRDSVGDFRVGDITVDRREMIFIVSESESQDDHLSISLAKLWYKDGLIDGIYPAESFKQFFKAGDD